MAILTRPKIQPQQRLDLEDWNALLSAARTDAKFQTKEFLSSNNLIFKGFVVTGIGLKSATVAMTDATLIIPQNTTDFSWYTASPSEPNIVIPDADITDGTRNYVEISLVNQDNTPLTKAFWDPSANAGAGAEFNQIVDTMTDLEIEMVVSTGGFSGNPNRLPLCIIDADNTGTIKAIYDQRTLFGRLGTPSNPEARFSWTSQIEPVTSFNLTGVSGTFIAGETVSMGTETGTVVVGGTTNITVNGLSGLNFASGDAITGSTSSASGVINTAYGNFTGADKDLGNQKQINDSLMTEIAVAKGVKHWYEVPAGSIGGLAGAINSIIAPFSSTAKYTWDGNNLELTDNLLGASHLNIIAKIRYFGQSSQLDLLRMDGQDGTTSIPIADGQVLFLKLPSSGDRAYSGVGSADTNYQVASRLTYALSDQNYWIAYREGTKLMVRFQGDLNAGETEPIGDTVPQTLLNNLGLVDTETPANYPSNIRGTANESLVSRIGVLTDAVGDEQEDRSGYLRSDQEVTWDGSQLTFLSDIILEIVNPKIGGGIAQHTIAVASSPITINDQESIYVIIDRTTLSETLTPVRSSVTPIPAQLQANKDLIVLFRRVAAGGVNYLHLPLMKQLLGEGQTVRLGQAGAGGSGAVKTTYYDPVSTTLPTGTAYTVDGIAVVDGDLVLFSALGSGNNEIYKVSGVGTSLSWASQRAFNGQFTPSAGDQVIVTAGTSFANQLGIWTGSEFSFNDVVRYFSGTDYWEQSSLKTTGLADNTTDTVFSVTASGSENIIMDYSVLRNSRKETGTAWITQNGTSVNVTQGGTYINPTGVTFSASISLGVLTVSYTTDSQGVGGTLKYSIKRWSDAAGGPGGPPSYSAGSGGGAGAAAGTDGDIQYNSGGMLAGNSNFQIDQVDGSVNLNGLRISPLSSGISIADNQVSPTALFSFNASTWRHAIIEYSVVRNGSYRTGRFIVSNDGSVTGESDDFVETSPTGVTLSSDVSGGNVRILYVSTSTGFSGVFTYSIRKWG